MAITNYTITITVDTSTPQEIANLTRYVEAFERQLQGAELKNVVLVSLATT